MPISTRDRLRAAFSAALTTGMCDDGGGELVWVSRSLAVGLLKDFSVPGEGGAVVMLVDAEGDIVELVVEAIDDGAGGGMMSKVFGVSGSLEG